MKKKMGRIVTSVFVAICVALISINSYAHSGRTDSSGGHRDNKNKSGLGSYHYHCGGHPAHLHKNGVCLYSSKAKKSSNKSKSNTPSKSSSTKTVSAKPVSVKATSIKINEEIENINVRETDTLTASILPANVTNKKISWKSSDESIATINSNGKITANKEGNVTITASTSNGKKATLKIKILEKEEKVEEMQELNEQNSIQIYEMENDIIIPSYVNEINDVSNTVKTQEESDAADGVITLGVLGGGYWLYRKFKNK